MMGNLLSVLALMTLSTLVWAEKSPELDQSKAELGIRECKRIADWRLIKKGDESFQITCAEDNLKFAATNSQIQSAGGNIRIGNFNLLHPGTDKTIFKDFSLVADLVNSEFDVMAGVELVDVVADAKKNNKKLQPLLEEKYKKVEAGMKLVQDQEQKVKELEAKIAGGNLPSSQNGNLDALTLGLSQALNEVRQLELKISEIKKQITDNELVIAKYSVPGFVFLGYEIFGRARLALLDETKKEQKQLLAENLRNSEKLKTINHRVASLESEIKNFKPSLNPEDQQKLDAEKAILVQFREQENGLWTEFRKFSRAYRVPGYLTLLEKLRELDPSWSLVVSPHGDAAEESNTQELVGFYYRSTRMNLANNIHCTGKYSHNSSACYPNFYASYMDADLSNMFSRRPFMATFNDGKSNFSLLAAHVIFEPPTSETKQKEMLKAAFAVESLDALGKGITKANFARFVEIKFTLSMMEKLKNEGVERLIYTGDLNLESNNVFWKTIFAAHPGMKLLVDSETSVSEFRFVNGKESNGVSSNYDHFIVSTEENQNCKNAERVNFISNTFSTKIKDKYLIRADAAKGLYPKDSRAEAIIAARTLEIEEKLKELNLMLVKDELKVDMKLVESDLKNFKERVFDSQLDDGTYYKMFVQIISDHLPIKMECSF